MGFSLVVTVIVAIIATYSVNEYRGLRGRMEQSLVREGLAVIASFEASARAGLAAPSTMSQERLIEMIQDTCLRAHIDYVAFYTPSHSLHYVTATSQVRRTEHAVSNLYSRLRKEPYCWQYEGGPDGRDHLTVSRALLLDNVDHAGKKTFRLYQMLLKNEAGEMKMVRAIVPIRPLASMPLITVALPATDIRALGREAVVRSLTLGLVVLLIGTTLTYVAVVIQQNRTVAVALAAARDENERLLRQLRRADQLALIDRMAATMAHELRNSLGAVRMFAQMLHTSPNAGIDQDTRENAQIVINEIDRVNGLISSVLGFSKPIEPMFAPSSIAELIENAVRLVRYDAMARKIELRTEVADELPPVAGDARLLMQMLMNLIVNAFDAMPDGGTLTIASVLVPGGRVRIEVRDTGGGIPPQLRAQVFEPFFTTKVSGTGLGLATVDHIVARHGGSVRIESEPNCGSAFVIDLPITQEEPA